MCEIEFSKLVTILEGIVDPKAEAIPLNVLTVVTGVAGSGKSPLVRDVFAKQYEDRVVLVDQSSITATFCLQRWRETANKACNRIHIKKETQLQ